MSDFPWHRVFHPLRAADPPTLLQPILCHGPSSPQGFLAYAVALAASIVRLPFTALDLAFEALGAAHPRARLKALH